MGFWSFIECRRCGFVGCGAPIGERCPRCGASLATDPKAETTSATKSGTADAA